MSRPFEAYRAGKLAQIERRYESYLAQGFATADFDDQPEAETLQCASELDRTNWIGLVLKCQAAIAQDAGDAPLDIPIRCTSNRMYVVSYSEALTRMFDLLNKAGLAQANCWRLKDLANAVPSREALGLIDLEEGWP